LAHKSFGPTGYIERMVTFLLALTPTRPPRPHPASPRPSLPRHARSLHRSSRQAQSEAPLAPPPILRIPF
jgi:hypothetical protein